MKYYVLVYIIFNLINIFITTAFPHQQQQQQQHDTEAAIISKYAKITISGATKNQTYLSFGKNRTSKSGNIFNHRSANKNPGDNNNNNKERVVYQYPVYPSRSDNNNSNNKRKTEHVPGIGEVLIDDNHHHHHQAEDRFESRPLFAYKNKFASPTYLPPSSSSSLSSSAQKDASSSKTGTNPSLYDSPYNSYNPPVFKPSSSSDLEENSDDSSSSSGLYPPNSLPSLSSSVSLPPKDAVMIKSPQKVPKINNNKVPNTDNVDDSSYVSLGPPLSLTSAHHHYDENDRPDNDDDDDDDQGNHNFPPTDPMSMYKQKLESGPPKNPPKSVDDIYYPSDFPKDQITQNHNDNNNDDDVDGDNLEHHHHHHHHQDDNMMMMINDDEKLTPPHEDNHDVVHNHHHHDDEAEEIHQHTFPKYLYDDHHYDNHIYEEIPHTTMMPVKEDQRVSNTHYSYYYLGRKLWYIPLYFSVYFIIYVTVLIIKSIARHKVKLKYKWYEHDTKKNHARSLDLFNNNSKERINDIHRNVTRALINGTKNYTNNNNNSSVFLAMK